VPAKAAAALPPGTPGAPALERFMQLLLALFLLVRDLLFFVLNFAVGLVNSLSLFVGGLLG